MRRSGGVSLVALAAMLWAWPGVAPCAAAPPASDSARAAPVEARLQPLDVVINQMPQGTWTLLEVSGALYADAEALRAWRILMPGGVPPVVYRERVWHPLFTLPGYRAQFDAANQAVALTLDPAAFVGTQLGQAPVLRPRPAPPLPALALNYDLSHTHLHDRGSRSLQDSGVLAEAMASGAWGVFSTSVVGRHVDGPQATGATTWRRLASTWTLDWPEPAWTLRAGDAATRSSIWGRSFQLGGLQLGSNFGLNPGGSILAVPTLSGSATGPSTVELYINDALRQTQQVGAGPFTIENLQGPPGAAEARIVVRDILGRETVIVRPFFTSTQLLRAGLTDWSFETGWLRRNLDASSSDYREGFAQGWLRHGWNARWTVESAVQVSHQLRHLSLGTTGALADTVLVQAALAGSDHARAGRGQSALLGMERSTHAWSLALRAVTASAGFRELGMGEGERALRGEYSVTFRRSWRNQWSLGVTAVRRQTHDADAVTSGTTSVGWTSPAGVTWLGQFTRVDGRQAGRSAFFSMIWPLDGRRVLGAQAGRSRGHFDAYASASSPIAAGSGLGWRVLAGRRSGGDTAEAGAYWQADRWFGSLDVRSGAGSQAARAGLQGALVAVDGSVFAAAPLQDAFALVEVPGQAGVVVGTGAGAGVRTDRRGRALLPRLAAFQENAIRIDPDAVPAGAQVEAFERAAVPAWRSAVKVVFPVRQGRAALVRVVLDDGQPAPPLAELSLEGEVPRFIVAHRGESYVTGLPAGASRLQLHWQGQTCTMTLHLPADPTAATQPAAPAEEVLRIGPLSCTGVRR